MERVLDNRDASWRRLGDFILRETETLEFEGPLGLSLAGFRREYEWYVRDDVVVRSPVRFDGVDIDEETRREYEADWLRQERRRRGRRDTRRRTLSRRDTERNVAIAIGCLRHSLLIRQPICVRAATRTMTARLG